VPSSSSRTNLAGKAKIAKKLPKYRGFSRFAGGNQSPPESPKSSAKPRRNKRFAAGNQRFPHSNLQGVTCQKIKPVPQAPHGETHGYAPEAAAKGRIEANCSIASR